MVSDGSYGIEKGLVYSFPIRSSKNQWTIVQGLALNDFSLNKIQASEAELLEEKAAVKDLGLI